MCSCSLTILFTSFSKMGSYFHFLTLLFCTQVVVMYCRVTKFVVTQNIRNAVLSSNAKSYYYYWCNNNIDLMLTTIYLAKCSISSSFEWHVVLWLLFTKMSHWFGLLLFVFISCFELLVLCFVLYEEESSSTFNQKCWIKKDKTERFPWGIGIYFVFASLSFCLFCFVPHFFTLYHVMCKS